MDPTLPRLVKGSNVYVQSERAPGNGYHGAHGHAGAALRGDRDLHARATAPREIRNSSTLMRAIHHATKVHPCELCRIGDLEDVASTFLFLASDESSGLRQHHDAAHTRR